ncbi:hypothetical protein [Pirellulimonas nuda]|nr:hypothetical protein [Pirellulimonas nuda]
MAYNLPPSERLMHPGPGVGGPGPGVIPVGNQMTMGADPSMGQRPYGPGGGSGGACPSYGQGCAADQEQNFMQAQGPMAAGGDIMQCGCFDGGCSGGSCPADGGMAGAGCMGGPPTTSQIAFIGEAGLQVQWDLSAPGMFDSSPLVVPGRQDFAQGAIYRLRLTNIPGHEVVTLYPTLEVAPVTPRTDAYLAHAPIPIQFTEEDFDQVISGNFVTKVIYLPDPEFQELALAGVETLVSTRLDPGCDPIAEADRRGSILAIVRIGNKDLESGRGMSRMGQVFPASYGPQVDQAQMVIEGEAYPGPAYEEEMYNGNGYQAPACEGSNAYTGQAPGGYAGGPMPMGAPTAGFAPNAVPPHMVPNYGPQYGMPITGTPIGIPGPPHIPLGVPAGLRNHTMVNRTRVCLPPPTPKVQVTVKQRPGMNYPAPVNHVHVNEAHRAPFKLFGGTVAPLGRSAVAAAVNAHAGGGGEECFAPSGAQCE